MLSVASTRTKSAAIIAVLGAICGLAKPHSRLGPRALARRLASAIAGLPLLLAGWMFLLPTTEAAESSVSYRVTFQGMWTTAATPGGLPDGAHFSPLVGAVHSDEVTFWREGRVASPGIELVAELGLTSTFKSEIDASEYAVATIERNLPAGGTPQVDVDFEVTTDHPLVTLITMIAPSPDWFVGVSDLSLLDAQGRWRPRFEVDLFPYDAGTEDGTDFQMSNPATEPQGRIHSIRGAGKFTDEPMAKLIFVRQGTSEQTLRVPLFPSALNAEDREGFVRVFNRSDEEGEVRIVAIDDMGMRSDPLTLSIAAGETKHFNSRDLEMGNPSKGLSGNAFPGQGDWRLELASSLDIEVLSYIRHTQDGFLTAMHDIAPSVGNSHRVVIFNPASNIDQVSLLRLINPGALDALVTITGTDDSGQSGEMDVKISVRAGASEWLSAEDLENGGGDLQGDLQGKLGNGSGKWRLTVESDQPLTVMSLLASPSGHLTNLSTAPVGGAESR